MSGSLEGKVCLITGSTSGIGRQAATELARMGATMVLMGRSRERLDETMAHIKKETGSETLDSIEVELASMESIRNAASEFLKRYDSLHILVNNAGAMFANREVSFDGLEMTFALNHIAYFLLTELLLETMITSAPARIVSTASGAHRMAKIDIEDLQSEKRYRGFTVYGNSKLMNILFTKELADRLKGTGVTANCFHPGFVQTKFGTNNPGFYRASMTLTRPFQRKVEKGAETLIHLATSKEVEGRSGGYYHDLQEVPPANRAGDLELQRRLWIESQKVCAIASVDESGDHSFLDMSDVPDSLIPKK